MKRDDTAYLRHILDAIELIDKYTAGMTQAWVDENRRGRDGVRPEDWLWDYSGPSALGQPLYVGGWKRRVSRQVFEQHVQS